MTTTTKTDSKKAHTRVWMQRPVQETAEESVEKLFREDIRDKKRTSTGAFHRPSHSGCTLPTYTESQLKKLAGPVREWNFNTPYFWTEFTQMPNDIQRIYLATLGKRFRIREKDLCDLFHCSEYALQNYLQAKNLSGIVEQAGEGLLPYRSAWAIFLHDEEIRYRESQQKESEEPTASTAPAQRVGKRITRSAEDVAERKAVAEALKQYRAENGLSVADLCSKVGLPRHTYNNLVSQGYASDAAIAAFRQILKSHGAGADMTTDAGQEVVAGQDTDIVTQAAEGSAPVEVTRSSSNELTISGSSTAVIEALTKLYAGASTKIQVIVTAC